MSQNSTVSPGVFTGDAIQKILAAALVQISASGAVDPHSANRYIITKGGIAALTLAAPTPGADDGLRIQLFSNTAYAHTLTATGLLLDGAGNVDLATFAAHAGASLELVAYNGKWIVKSLQGVTIS